MTGEQFRQWQEHLRLSGVEVAKLLGKSTDTVGRYRKNGVPEPEATAVGLACSAIALRLEPWRRECDPVLPSIYSSLTRNAGRQSIIYAVTMSDRPGVVKIGMTRKWQSRREAYRPIDRSVTYAVEMDAFALAALERSALEKMDALIHAGREWFLGSIDQAAAAIEAAITSAELPFSREDNSH